jgi:YrbI family 3-deoxy-D-manno-octulosonate 8-phosphate phosphatase
MSAFDLTGVVRLIACDVDGTLTDGKIHITEKGDEFKSFDARDGLAMTRLNRNGVKVALISHSHAQAIIRRRAEILNLELFYAGHEKKCLILQNWINQLHIRPEEVLYLGDDLNDLDALDMCGWRACPADACAEVKSRCQIRLSRKGGDGVFRELAEKYFYTLLMHTYEPSNV